MDGHSMPSRESRRPAQNARMGVQNNTPWWRYQLFF